MPVHLDEHRATTIAVLGIDGSGKSTLAEGLVGRLSLLGLPTRLIKTESGRSGMDRLAIKSGYTDLGSMVGPSTATMMEASIGWRSLRSAKPAMRVPRSVVVFDRHEACHVALATMRSPEVVDDVRRLFSPFRRPDITLLVTVTTEVAVSRLARRGASMHPAAFLASFQDAYLGLPEAHRFVIIDGRPPPGDVLESAWSALGGVAP